mgnify:CR=1 FL=1
MTRKQAENFQELWSNLTDLAGDIIGIQNFLDCKADCIEDFGTDISGAYLRRLKDYIAQHIQEIQKLADILLIPELREIC